MGLTLRMPSAGLLGISGTTVSKINSDLDFDGFTTPGGNRIVVCENPATLPTGSGTFTALYTITLPTNPADNQNVLIKGLGSNIGQTYTGGVYGVQIASSLFEGTNQTIEITNNQSIRLIYLDATTGWLIA